MLTRERYRLCVCVVLLSFPAWLNAGLGQGPIDFGKRQTVIQGKMYGGTMYRGSRVQSYRNLRYGMSQSNSSFSRFNRHLNAPSQGLRYSTHVRANKQSIWSRMKSGLFKMRDTRMMDTGHYRHQGLSIYSRRSSPYSNTVRLDNGEKGTRRISSAEINQFVDPRARERSGPIPVQGPVEVIPLKK